MLTAAVVTAALLGKSAGAVYKPVAEIVPTELFPPTIPLTLHVTAASLVFVTSAEKSCVLPRNTELDCGVTFRNAVRPLRQIFIGQSEGHAQSLRFRENANFLIGNR
jgi:hypothetical protein